MHVKVMVIFQGGTNLPEDRFVNTLHFDSPASTLPLAMADIGPEINLFWNTPGAGDNLGKAMPVFVSRTVVTKAYDMGTLAPRVPLESTFTIGTPIVATALPEEVAVVASFHGDPPVTGRRRGRIYLGPLSAYAQTSSSATEPVRVIAAYSALVVARMEDLATAAIGWSVYSPTTSQLIPVTAGFCDNAFDTQRRRGPESSSRVLWP